jgi:hypothetical protein
MKTKRVALILLLTSALAAAAGASNKTGTVYGLVVDGYGDPVPGALVVIKGANRFATTNAEGYYVISPVPVGTFEITASRIGFDDATKEDVKVSAAYYTTVNFVLGSGPLTQNRTEGAIEGRVVDPTGYPLKNVRVYLLENDDDVATDAEGAFSFDQLEPGFYTVRAECGCYLLQTGRVLVTAGEVTPLQFILWPDTRSIQFGL